MIISRANHSCQVSSGIKSLHRSHCSRVLSLGSGKCWRCASKSIPVINSLRDVDTDAKFGIIRACPPPPKLAIKVFLFFRSLPLGAQQVLDAWDAWQTVESGDDTTDVNVVAPTLGKRTSNTWLGPHHEVVSAELELIPMNTGTTNAYVRWGRTIKNAISFVSASVYLLQCPPSASQMRHSHIQHPTIDFGRFGR